MPGYVHDKNLEALNLKMVKKLIEDRQMSGLNSNTTDYTVGGSLL